MKRQEQKCQTCRVTRKGPCRCVSMDSWQTCEISLCYTWYESTQPPQTALPIFGAGPGRSAPIHTHSGCGSDAPVLGVKLVKLQRLARLGRWHVEVKHVTQSASSSWIHAQSPVSRRCTQPGQHNARSCNECTISCDWLRMRLWR